MKMFQTRPFWKCMRISQPKIIKRYQYFFGESQSELNREEALKLLINITSTIQNEMVEKLNKNNSFDMLMKLYFIFDEVHAFYLEEKEARVELAKLNISEDALETFITNRNIMRNIIDACNIWIENSVLYQHDVEKMLSVGTTAFDMDEDLIIDLYLYGFASQNISLLTLSKNVKINNLYYGFKITPKQDIPGEVLNYHPIIFFNTAITGNQNVLEETPLTTDSNNTDFGRGFLKSYGVELLLFLATLKGFQDDILRGDEKSLTVISKETFLQLAESYTNPKIDGEKLYDSFVLTREKIKGQLRKKEEIIWLIGCNKERHELRPFIGLEDENVLISYGAVEQAKQLWVSYFSNGGMCYSKPEDQLTNAMNMRNQELSDILVERIREILNNHYEAKVDLKDVKYNRIFGDRDINYGDFDVVYYVEEIKELFLIEAKYFSDSLNSSGMVTDFKKLFQEEGYYDHCKRRYDLVLKEPEKVKTFIGVQGNIKVHLIFLSSKPLEVELQDDDKIVTFLSLNIFDKYLAGNLISDEDNSVVRPIKEI